MTPRAKILDAAVEVLAQHGFADTTVTLVTQRAGVSRRTFGEHFDGLQECVAAVLEQCMRYSLSLIAEAFDQEPDWRDGMRAALATNLDYMDAQPALARVAIVEALAAGPGVLAQRERLAAMLRSLVVSRIEREVPHAWPHAPEAMFAAVLGMAHSHLAARRPGPLIGLLAPLMATIVAPYSDAGQIAEEVARSQELVGAILARRTADALARRAHANWAGVAIPAFFAHPRARHLGECLRFIAEHPDCCNQEVAAAVGVAHASQISRLLSRLAGAALITKRSGGPGRRNVWRLTPLGEEVLRGLGGAESSHGEIPDVNRLVPLIDPVD